MASKNSPEVLRVGRFGYTRRELLKGGFALGIGALLGVLSTEAVENFIKTYQTAEEVVSSSEIVRGSLLASFDQNGNPITNTLVPGDLLIMVVSETPAPNYAVKQVEATGVFKDFENPSPVIATINGPNFGSNYLLVANMNSIQGGIPKGSPFQISYTVSFVGPDGQTGSKLNDPGPLQFTRV